MKSWNFLRYLSCDVLVLKEGLLKVGFKKVSIFIIATVQFIINLIKLSMADKKEAGGTANSNGSDQTSYTKKVLMAAGIFIPVILILWLLGVAFKVLLLILAAVLVASLFRGIAGYIHRYIKIPMGWSLLASVLLVIGIFALAGLLIAPQVGDQVNQLAEKFPETVQGAKDQLNQSSVGRKLVDQVPENPQKWLQEKSGVIKQSMGVFSATFGVLTDLYIIFFVGIFIMAQPKSYQKGIVTLVPISSRERAQEVLDKLGSTLQRWIAGKLFSMLVVAVLSSLGLWILGVPLALALGFIAGLLSFVPNFGPNSFDTRRFGRFNGGAEYGFICSASLYWNSGGGEQSDYSYDTKTNGLPAPGSYSDRPGIVVHIGGWIGFDFSHSNYCDCNGTCPDVVCRGRFGRSVIRRRGIDKKTRIVREMSPNIYIYC